VADSLDDGGRAEKKKKSMLTKAVHPPRRSNGIGLGDRCSKEESCTWLVWEKEAGRKPRKRRTGILGGERKNIRAIVPLKSTGSGIKKTIKKFCVTGGGKMRGDYIRSSRPNLQIGVSQNGEFPQTEEKSRWRKNATPSNRRKKEVWLMMVETVQSGTDFKYGCK